MANFWRRGLLDSRTPHNLELTEKDAVPQIKLWSLSEEGQLHEVAVYNLDKGDSAVIKGDYDVAGMVNKAGVTSITFTPDGKVLLAGNFFHVLAFVRYKPNK